MYVHFCNGFDKDRSYFDYSDNAMIEAYNVETFGLKEFSAINAFIYGKQQLNLHVTSWKEDMNKGTLFMVELYYGNENIPHWWLNSIFDRKYPPVNWNEKDFKRNNN